MKKILALLLMGAMTFSAASCGVGDGGAEEVSTELNILMPEQYISASLVDQFEESNSCTVTLTALKDENEAMELLTAETDAYDLIMTKDKNMDVLVDEEYVKKIDKDNLPNSSTILDTFWRSKSYSLPYLMQYQYVVYDAKTCPVEITRYIDLLDPALKGQISAVDGERVLFPMALAALGLDPNTTEEAEIEKAYNWLTRFIENVVVYGDGKQALLDGTASVALMYDRDAAEVMAKKSSLKIAPFVKDKVRLETDVFVIPVKAQHVDLAEKFLNYICDPEVMAANLEEYPYSCPNVVAEVLSSKEYQNRAESQFDYKETVFFQKETKEEKEIYDRFYEQLKNPSVAEE